MSRIRVRKLFNFLVLEKNLNEEMITMKKRYVSKNKELREAISNVVGYVSDGCAS